MALPKHLQPALTPDELTFLAEHDHVDIVPSFSMSRVRLLSGVYGPFQPPAPATVPLWMALSLKRKRKCRVVAPDWLRTESLKDLIEREKTNSEGFEPLPRRFVETAKVLLDVAPDDLNHPAQLRSLLKDLREVRQAKIRMGLQMQDTIQGGYLNVQGLTPLELTELKPFLVKAMSMMQTLEPKTDDGQGYGASQD